MRFTLRATVLAVSISALLTGGTVSASVAASAGENTAVAASVTPSALPRQPVVADVLPPTARTKARVLTRALTSSAMPAIAWTLRDTAEARTLRVVRLRTLVVEVARRQIGDRYIAGASGPSAFDCSGFTRYVYKVATGRELPHYSRAQYGRVKRISLKQARPGDLVFFLRNGAHHVGIYLGHGHMVDAAGYGEGVRISPISGSWWSRSFTGFGRILPA